MPKNIGIITTSDDALEADTITSQIWNTGPSAEIMFQMLWESPHCHHEVKYGPHLHLFAAWCARRVSYLLIDKKSLHAIQTAELFASATVSRAVMHQAHLAAQALVIETADTYERLARKASGPTHPGASIDTTATRAAAVLNAASAAATCCLSYQPFAPLRAADLCAKYARQSIYWEALTNGADAVLITELLEEENLRQAHTLRAFIGNPFSPSASPAMCLPASQSEDFQLST